MDKALENCKVYTIEGIPMIHISEFADITHRSVQSTRALIEGGNVVRKLKAYRDRSRLMIPVAEIYGFPLVNAGHSNGSRQIFHYQYDEEEGTMKKVLCTKCTYEMGCEMRKAIDELNVPKGDA